MTSHTPFLDRYDDPTPPTVRGAWSDFWHRAFLPALGLWALVVAVGLVIVGPLDGWRDEARFNDWLQEGRTPLLDSLTYWWSRSGDVPPMTIACVVIGAFIWWRTGRWWIGVLPGVALALEAFVFLTATIVVGRERPDTPQLDDAPPTSGYPSGHVGASAAFYLTLALLARRITHPALRRVVMAVCVAIPILIAFSRLYRGMHHASDVVMGAVNGVTCVVLAWRYLSRDPEKAEAGTSSDADAGTDAGAGTEPDSDPGSEPGTDPGTRTIQPVSGR